MEVLMSLIDGLLAFGILAAAGWVFYRSYLMKKGPCAGCSGCSCGKDINNGKDRLIRLS